MDTMTQVEREEAEMAAEFAARRGWELEEAPKKVARRNPWEEANRARKVLRLVEAVDRRALRVGVNPHTQAAMVRDALDVVDWVALANEAGVHAPSETTVREVEAVYVRRAA